MQLKYYLVIAFVAALSLFLPVTLHLARSQVEQFPTCKHKLWIILFIGKQCEDLKNDIEIRGCNRRCGESNYVKCTFCSMLCLKYSIDVTAADLDIQQKSDNINKVVDNFMAHKS